MRKLALKIDDLAVESFQTAPGIRARGTVLGAAATQLRCETPQTRLNCLTGALNCLTGAINCGESIIETCENNTCQRTHTPDCNSWYEPA